MWHRAVDALVQGGVQQICMVVPAADVSRLQADVRDGSVAEVTWIVAGGRTRAESVQHGVRAVLQSTASPTIIAIHDAARPFVATVDVRRVLDAAIEHGGAMLAQPLADTLHRTEADVISATLARGGLWRAQTPQAFAAGWLQDAYIDRPYDVDAADDAMIMTAMGHPVHVVPASDYNEKVTTAADYEVAQCLAVRRWGAVGS